MRRHRPGRPCRTSRPTAQAWGRAAGTGCRRPRSHGSAETTSDGQTWPRPPQAQPLPPYRPLQPRRARATAARQPGLLENTPRSRSRPVCLWSPMRAPLAWSGRPAVPRTGRRPARRGLAQQRRERLREAIVPPTRRPQRRRRPPPAVPSSQTEPWRSARAAPAPCRPRPAGCRAGPQAARSGQGTACPSWRPPPEGTHPAWCRRPGGAQQAECVLPVSARGRVVSDFSPEQPCRPRDHGAGGARAPGGRICQIHTSQMPMPERVIAQVWRLQDFECR